MPKHALVTGGGGFIGSHLVDALIARGDKVTILDDFSTGSRSFVPEQAELIEADLATPQARKHIAGQKFDLVFHLAAQKSVGASVIDPLHDARINLIGLLQLMEGLRDAGSKAPVIFASSGGTVYGDPEIIPTSEAAPTIPTNPYGVAKLSSEHYLEYYRKIHGIPYAAMRLANVYGPRQDPKGEAGVIAIFAERALRGDSLVINGDGKQTRDFVFVADVVAAFLTAEKKATQGLACNIGTGIETSINQIAELVVQAAKSSSTIKYEDPKPGEPRRSALNANLAAKELGFTPAVTLEQGIKQTVDSFAKSLV